MIDKASAGECLLSQRYAEMEEVWSEGYMQDYMWLDRKGPPVASNSKSNGNGGVRIKDAGLQVTKGSYTYNST